MTAVSVMWATLKVAPVAAARFISWTPLAVRSLVPWQAACLVLVVLTANLCGVFGEGEPVEAGGIGVAERQVKFPPVAGVVPVVGELLAADFVADQPGSVRAGEALSTWAGP